MGRGEKALTLILLFDLLRAEVQRQQIVVGVAVHARAVELLQQVDALARLGTALRDVSEGDDQARVAFLQIGENRSERSGVAVHVGDETDSHPLELTVTS